MPYSATNITEFWRRWHISLSTWLRDYLYIPLGGNRRGTARTYLNLIITMLLGGLWHGASWNFIIWGGLHGAALAGHKLWMSRTSGKAIANESWIWTSFSRILTLGIVLVGWIFFRSQTLGDAGRFLWRLFSFQNSGTRFISPQILAALIIVSFAHWYFSKQRNWAEEIIHRPVLVRITAYTILTTIIVCFAATDASPFIYFQF